MEGTGHRPWPRVGALVLLGALVVGATGCADDGGGVDAAAPPVTATPSTAAPPSTSALTSSPGAAPTGPPAAEATPSNAFPPTVGASSPRTRVPIDEELVERLPRFSFYDGLVSDDPTFDLRFCDGTAAPTLPIGQARATYDIADDENLTVAAYRFAPGTALTYAGPYTEAVRRCADDVAEANDLGLLDGVGSSFRLVTPDGSAFMAVAVDVEDVLWVAFQVRVGGGPVDLDRGTIATFIAAVEG